MPPKPQVVFYQSGLASTESFDFISILQGATAAGLGDKVQEAYGFIAHNYEPGDEVRPRKPAREDHPWLIVHPSGRSSCLGSPE